MQRIESNMWRRKSTSKWCRFQMGKTLARCKLGTEKYCPDLCAFLAFHILRWWTALFESSSFTSFVKKPFFNSAQLCSFLQLVQTNSWSKAKMLSEICIRTAYIAELHYHLIVSLSNKSGKYILNLRWDTVSSTLASIVVQLVSSVSDTLSSSSRFEPPQAGIEPYFWFNPKLAQSEVRL